MSTMYAFCRGLLPRTRLITASRVANHWFINWKWEPRSSCLRRCKNNWQERFSHWTWLSELDDRISCRRGFSIPLGCFQRSINIKVTPWSKPKGLMHRLVRRLSLPDHRSSHSSFLFLLFPNTSPSAVDFRRRPWELGHIGRCKQVLPPFTYVQLGQSMICVSRFIIHTCI